MSGDARRALGAAGEDAVARWYVQRGYAVLDRNWRVRAGELDLVLGRDGVVVFCEVKTRRGDAFGSPFEAVTQRKQHRIRGLALRWLADRRVRASTVRFDVAAVTMRPGERSRVEIVEAAF